MAQYLAAKITTNQEGKIPLDNDPKNAYIPPDGNGTGQQTTVDEETEKYARVLNETFGGDPVKAVKSYLSAQTEYTKKAKELSEIKPVYDKFNQVLSTNPTLFEMVQKASQGEDVENLLRAKKEPVGQSSAPIPANKLENSTSDVVTEDVLVKSGLIDPNRKSMLTDLEWQTEVLRATQRYMVSNYPRVLAEKAQEELNRVQTQAREAAEREQIKNENQRRYSEGIKAAAMQGWDFTGEHSTLLEEIEEEMIGIRDSKDLRLLRDDAVEIALERVARRKNIKLKNPEPIRQGLMDMGKNMQQRNITSRGSDGNQAPTDLLGQLLLKGMEQQKQKNRDYLRVFAEKNKG